VGVHEADACCEEVDAGECCLHRTWGNDHRRPAEDIEGLAGANAPDAVFGQNPGDLRRAQKLRIFRRGGEIPEIEKLGSRDIVAELQHLRVVPPELLPDAVG
jgi:hypothetical protein